MKRPAADDNVEEAPAAETMKQKTLAVSAAPQAKGKLRGGSVPTGSQNEMQGGLRMKVPQAVISEGAAQVPSAGRKRTEAPSDAARSESGITAAAPTTQSGAATLGESAEAMPAAPEQPEQRHIAVLSDAVKLEIVRGVRQRIADESAWLPGKVDGKTAYAAKMDGMNLVLVDAKNPEATRFSLMGAFLLELDARQVIATAAGRKDFLDEEILDGIREVLAEQMDDEQRESLEDPLENRGLLGISHEQCLAVLERLEERYLRRAEQLRTEKARKRLGNVRLADLVKKLEMKARILPEDVATALYHELAEVRRRLERLEGRRAREK